jgi:Ca2+-binding RTX toxin-like protein
VLREQTVDQISQHFHVVNGSFQADTTTTRLSTQTQWDINSWAGNYGYGAQTITFNNQSAQIDGTYAYLAIASSGIDSQPIWTTLAWAPSSVETITSSSNVLSSSSGGTADNPTDEYQSYNRTVNTNTFSGAQVVGLTFSDPGALALTGPTPQFVAGQYTSYYTTYQLGEFMLSDGNHFVTGNGDTAVIGGMGDNVITGAGFAYGGTGAAQLLDGDTEMAGTGDQVLRNGRVMVVGDGHDMVAGRALTGQTETVWQGVGWQPVYHQNETQILVNPNNTGVDLLLNDTPPAPDYNYTVDRPIESIYWSQGVRDFYESYQHGGQYSLNMEWLPAYFDTVEEARTFFMSIGADQYLSFDDVLHQVTPLAAIYVAAGTAFDAAAWGPVSTYYDTHPLQTVAVSANDFAFLQPYLDAGVVASKTVDFGPGLSLADIRLSWGQVVSPTDGATRIVLNMVWGVDQGVQVMMPKSGDAINGAVTRFSFANGQSLSMQQLLALAPPAPNFDTLAYADLSLRGTAADDVMLGTAAADLIDGLAGADTMSGGKGDDTYYVDNVLDKAVEKLNEGRDTVQSLVSYTLGANVEDLVLKGIGVIDGTGNTLANTLTGNGKDNKLTGGAGDDTLIGMAGDDRLTGGTGADLMLGGTGDDFYEVDNAQDVVTELANEGIDVVESAISYTLGANVENLILTGTAAINAIGNALDNDLQGNDSANILTGGAGDDSLNGKKGLDTLIGGSGNDTYLFEDDVDTIVEAAGDAGGRDMVISRQSFTLAANVEDGILLGTATTINGNELANVLSGNGAANTIDGGAGADVMLGGKGNDLYIVDNQADTIVEIAAEGTDTVQVSVNYSLADNLENLTLTGTAEAGMGNALANVLTGNAASNKLWGLEGNDTLDGGAGADILIGGLGNDKYYVDNASDLVVETAAEGTDTVYSSVSHALEDNVENLVLTGTANINGVGNALNNRIEGNAGNNILFGGLGNDTYVFGRGSGQDIIVNFDAGKPSGDVVQLGAGIVGADVAMARRGDDLILRINGTSDQLTVASYYQNGGKGANALEKIRFADGTSLNHAAVLALTTVESGTSDAQGVPLDVKAGNAAALFNAPVAAATKTLDAPMSPGNIAESIAAARARFEQGLQALKYNVDEAASLSRSEFTERRALPLLWNLQDALLDWQLAKNADGRFTADISIDSRASRDLGLGITVLGATYGVNAQLNQVDRAQTVQQFDLAHLN